MAEYLLLIFMFLLAGVIAVPVATRFGLGSVLGYLLAGIALSPALAVLNVDVETIQHFAEFGVVMMLFIVGLELEPRKLWDLRAQLLGLGGLQVLGTAAAVALAGVAFGFAWPVAITAGLVLALSSTAIVLQTLSEKGLMKSGGGKASFSVLLFQDIAVIPMLAFIPLLASPELLEFAAAAAGDGHGSLSLIDGLEAWQATLVTIAAIGAVIFGGSRLATPLFDFIAVTRLRELFTAAALMLVVGIALLMLLVGLSPALGTFIAGVVLANSQYRHELESDIEPFKGLLLGLFFMTVGAGINFGLFVDHFMVITAATLVLILVKVCVLLLLGKLFGLNGTDRWLPAIALAQAGEFGFVLLAFSVANGVLPRDLANLLLLVVAMSMLLTPLLFIVYERVISPRFSARQEREADSIEPQGDIIIAGHGRFGGIVNRMLRGMGYATTVVDFSATQLDILRKYGLNVYYGDATRPDLLRAAGIENAKLLIIAIDDKQQTTRLARHVIEHYPTVHVIARAWDRDHTFELWSIGCRDIIRETYDGAIRTGRTALEALGIPPGEARQMANAFEAMDRESMVEIAGLYRIDVPNHENPEYVAKVREMREEWEKQLRGRVEEIRRTPGVTK